MNPIINNSIRQKMLDLFLKETDSVYLIYFDYTNMADAANLSALTLKSEDIKFAYDYTGEFRPGYKGPEDNQLSTTVILGTTYSYLTTIPTGDLKENTIVKADNLNGRYYTYLIAPNTEIDFSDEITYRGVALVANAVANGDDLDFTESDIVFIQTFNELQKQDSGTKRVPLVVNF